MNRSQMQRVIVDHVWSMGFFAWPSDSVDVFALVNGKLFAIQWSKPWHSPQEKEKVLSFFFNLKANGATFIESDDPKEIEMSISDFVARGEILG